MLLTVLTSGCVGGANAAPIRFEKVALPPGAQPEVLAAVGDAVLIGVRRDSDTTRPGLERLGRDGTITDVPVTAATPYGHTASWYSLTSDGDHVLGIGGDRGGAHGNVRWSVWSGSGRGIAEHAQAFSTFGGWGAGDLVDAVLTPIGPALVGSWQSAGAGLDVAVWQASGDTWSRRGSTGTPLESTASALGFPIAATGVDQGILVVGWQFAAGVGGAGQAPVAWRSAAGTDGWTRTPLPGGGSSGAAMAARCPDATTCLVAGRVDGELALWRLVDGGWSRVAGVPVIPVGENDRLPAPLPAAAGVVQLVSDAGQVTIVDIAAGKGTMRPAEGPSGAVVSAVEAGGSVYLLAGPSPDALSLWRADAAALGLSLIHI